MVWTSQPDIPSSGLGAARPGFLGCPHPLMGLPLPTIRVSMLMSREGVNSRRMLSPNSVD